MLIFFQILGVLFLSIFLMVGCSFLGLHFQKDELDEIEKQTSSIMHNKGIPYEIVFEPELPFDLKEQLLNISKLHNLRLNKPISNSALLKRVQKDKELFEDILIREGYFKGKITLHLVKQDDQSDLKVFGSTSEFISKTVRIIFNIDLKERYRYGNIIIKGRKIQITNQANIEKITRLSHQDFVDLEKVQQAKSLILLHLKEQGYVDPLIDQPYAEIDHKKQTVDIVFPVNEQYKGIISAILIEGAPNVDSKYLFNRLKQTVGQTFNEKLNQESRNELISTNIIGTAEFKAIPIDEKACLNTSNSSCYVLLKTKLTESPPRSIGLGFRYSSSTGIGGQAFWHHYNLLGSGEHLYTIFQTSSKELMLKIGFDVPDVHIPNDFLSTTFVFSKTKTTAFDSNLIAPQIVYNTKIFQKTRGSIGLLYQKGHAKSNNKEDEYKKFPFNHMGIPTKLSFDTTDSILDATEGIRGSFLATPYFNTYSHSFLSMIQLESLLNIFFPVLLPDHEENKLIFAGSLKIATLQMKNFKAEAPPIFRYYSGGPYSIRSYGYQKIGPVDKNGTPIGGRSVMEWITELRYRYSETLGLVVFLEAGSVLRNGIVSIDSKNFLYGGGLGIRYYSMLGPIRFDIGVPFKKRRVENGRTLDSAFQICISIGQIF